MQTLAVVLNSPKCLALNQLELTPPGEDDVVVDVEWSGVSTGTERLLWQGRMPHFPGMGYPLVPGYESVGRISATGKTATDRLGERVFVPGARCFGEVRGLFGGAASRLVVPAERALPIDDLGEEAVLLALAATAYHALPNDPPPGPQLIVGHGVLGRLLARLIVAKGLPPPVVWELDPVRARGAYPYSVFNPSIDHQREYHTIFDVSGDGSSLDTLISRLVRGGEVVLAGFYSDPLTFAFPPAFLREARLRVSAEWQPADLLAVKHLVRSGALSLDGLITHRVLAHDAERAYRVAFEDPTCLKMILDWRS